MSGGNRRSYILLKQTCSFKYVYMTFFYHQAWKGEQGSTNAYNLMYTLT